ncbi:N-acetylmuramoyl-L-alanine amidase [Clostridium perfringens]|uniref:N-acetylmuramoyl-L-alanine amidase n=1 Tax=Clostridium perfringens TaxID=1502 RepID=UPI002AC6F373|nr:N-acetylmuramoyl-L-alanine amidase [Clostridium perfringens]
MKIGLRAGHSKNCRGANGLRDEWESMNIFYGEVARVLEEYGHTVVNCNSSASSVNAELTEGANKANNAGVDLFISLHMNSFNGSAHGTEALTWGESSRANVYAKRMCANFASLGFYNRGLKYQPNFYEMRHVNAPNVIFETCFCDSQKDIDIWSPLPWDTLARAVANAIDPNIPLKKEEIKKKYQVRVYSFTEKEDAENASKEIDNLGYYNVVEEM